MSEGWERRQEQTRRDVVTAAGALIAEGGVEALTMRKLAERAGVSVATLYNQFGDRDGVLVAFVSSGLANSNGPAAMQSSAPRNSSAALPCSTG